MVAVDDEKDVFGLDVAMADLEGVHVSERRSDMTEETPDDPVGKLGAGDERVQSTQGAVLEHEEEARSCLEDVVQLDDVWMSDEFEQRDLAQDVVVVVRVGRALAALDRCKS